MRSRHAAQTRWQQNLAEQIRDEYGCTMAFFSNVTEREVAGMPTVIARVHREDKRVYDAVLEPTEPSFKIRERALVAR